MRSAPEALMGEAPAIPIAGASYKLRRLGYRDCFLLAGIIGDIIKWGSFDLKAVMGKELGLASLSGEVEETLAQGLLLLLFGASDDRVRERILDWLASVLSVSAEDIRDPEKFPLDTLPGVVEGVAGHPDILSFFGSLQGLKMAKEFLQTTMTPSRGS